MASRTKVGSTWKSINGIKVKVGSTWKTATDAYVKVNGVWKRWAAAMPDVSGTSGDAATSTLTALGLTVTNNSSSSSNSAYSGFSGGYVYSQSPASGALVGPGDSVTLTSYTYSGGTPTPGPTPTPPPSQDSYVTSLSPTTAAAGTTLTINGSFPSPITNISFGGSNVPTNSWNQQATSITCTIPSGTGTVGVQVFNGKVPLMTELQFTYGTGGTTQFAYYGTVCADGSARQYSSNVSCAVVQQYFADNYTSVNNATYSCSYGTGYPALPTCTVTPTPTPTFAGNLSAPVMSGSGTTVTSSGGTWSQTPVVLTFDFYMSGTWTGQTYTRNVWLGESQSFTMPFAGAAGYSYTSIVYASFDFSGTSYGASSSNSYTVPSGGGGTTVTYYTGYSLCNGPSGNYGQSPSVTGPFTAASIPADFTAGSPSAREKYVYRTTSAAALADAAQAACQSGVPTPTPTPTPTAVTCSGGNCSLAACQTCDPNLSSTGTRSVSTSICSSGIMNTYTCYTPGSCSNIVSDTGCVATATWYCTESYSGGGVGNCTYTTSTTNNPGSGSGFSRSCSQGDYPACQSTGPAPTPTPTPTPTPAPTLDCTSCVYGYTEPACPSGQVGYRYRCITNAGCADYDITNTCTAAPSPTPTPAPTAAPVRKYVCKSYDVTNSASANYYTCYSVGQCAADFNSDGSRATCYV